jgi:hypothetical protein
MGCPCENENSVPFYNECAQTTPSEVSGCVTTPTTDCITYKGSTLGCTDFVTGTPLNDIITEFDERLCSLVGSEGSVDWVSMNTACLGTVFGEENTIVTLQAFVETISAQYCQTKSDVEDLQDSSTTYSSQISSILNPTITGCAYLGSSSAYDTYAEAMQLYATKLCDLDSRLSLTGVVWNNCFTATTPTSIASAFSLLASQICSVKTVADDAYGSATGADKFVRTSALDTTSSYLMDKLTFSSCFTATETTGVAGSKVHVGLVNNMKSYAFNNTQFETTTLTSTTCTDNFSIALSPSFLDSLSTIVDCTTVGGLFVDSTAAPSSLYGTNEDGCVKVTNCQALEFLASGLTSDNYVLKVDTTGVDSCDKYQFVPQSSIGDDCTALGWTDLQPTMVVGGIATNPAVTWTAVAGNINSVPFGALSDTYPQYRWNRDGDLKFKGGITTAFSGTAGAAAGHTYHYDIVLGTISNPCSNPINAQEHFCLADYIEDPSLPGTFLGLVTAFLGIDDSGVVSIRIYVRVDDNLHDFEVIVPLSGIIFSF